MGEEEEEPEPMPDLKRCPVDQSWMAHNQNPTHVYHGCPKCRCLWLPGTELEMIFKGTPPDLSRAANLPFSHHRCPEGHGFLHQVILQDASIAQCKVCGGLWVMEDAIKTLKPLLRSEVHLKPPGMSEEEARRHTRHLPYLWLEWLFFSWVILQGWWFGL